MKLCLGQIRPVDLEDTLRGDLLYCDDGRIRPVWLQEMEEDDFQQLLPCIRCVLNDVQPTIARVFLPGVPRRRIADHELMDGDVVLYICFHADEIGRRVYLCVMGDKEGIDLKVFDRLDRMTAEGCPGGAEDRDVP